jgi:hypothetical protein
MTEEEWLTVTNPVSLLSLSSEKIQKRKLWLFGCACCYRIWELLIHPASRLAVEVAERFAEGEAERSELDRAIEGAKLASNMAHEDAEPFASAPEVEPASYGTAARAVYKLVYHARPVGWSIMQQPIEAASVASGRSSEDAAQVALFCDIFGNPFRPVTFSPEWRTDTAVSLASQMYQSRDFSAMPILADALQDAGCDNADILDHCRSPGPHVRGCWVVDLVLGKQ